MPRAKVAEHLGVSRQTLYDIINEKRAVTADIAARFGRAFGNSALSGSICRASTMLGKAGSLLETEQLV